MTDRLQQTMRSLRRRLGADADLDDVVAALLADGYDHRQIGEIMTRWRSERRPPEATPPPPSPRQFQVPTRVLGPHEWGRFSPEAWGRLMALQGSGVLSLQEMERVIEQALEQGDGRVALAELDMILGAAGLGSPEPGPDTDFVTIH